MIQREFRKPAVSPRRPANEPAVYRIPATRHLPGPLRSGNPFRISVTRLLSQGHYGQAALPGFPQPGCFPGAVTLRQPFQNSRNQAAFPGPLQRSCSSVGRLFFSVLSPNEPSFPTTHPQCPFPEDFPRAGGFPQRIVTRRSSDTPRQEVAHGQNQTTFPPCCQSDCRR
jgi:hypothetical protein